MGDIPKIEGVEILFEKPAVRFIKVGLKQNKALSILDAVLQILPGAEGLIAGEHKVFGTVL